MFGIRVMKRNKQFVPQSSLVTLNKSLIQPYYDYCFPLWGNFEQSLAARVITGARYDDKIGSSNLLQSLGWDTSMKITLLV